MKRKVAASLLIGVLAVSLTACGQTADSGTADSSTGESQTTQQGSQESQQTGSAEENGEDEYRLENLNIVVNGTLNAGPDAGMDDFVKQWEAAIEEKLGYHVTLQIQKLDHSSYTDSVGRLFSSGDYPDALLMGADMVKQYAPTGILWDLSDAYDNAEFQARMTLPEINERMKDKDGHLYVFSPAYGNGCVTYVKQSWLDAVGISIDDIKTYDDYYNMLMAFHEGDPDGNGVTGDTYGVVAAGFVGNEAPFINYLPEFWQDAYPSLVQDENGVWYDGFQTDATKAALLRLQKAYADGAIDPETLTASTKIAREKYFSNDQKGSSGAFTYWAGAWYQTLMDNMSKNEVDSDLVMLPPIEEVGAYLNREAGGWCIIDDGDGDDRREKAVFDVLIGTMMDGDKVQTLWTYGAEGVHWSTAAETFTTNLGTEKEKVYEYQEGEFHLRPSLLDPNSLWKSNAIDPSFVVCALQNGYTDTSELAVKGNKFFTENCIDAPQAPSCDTYTNEAGTIHDAKLAAITLAVVEGRDVDTAMEAYKTAAGSIIDQCLKELNGEN